MIWNQEESSHVHKNGLLIENSYLMIGHICLLRKEYDDQFPYAPKESDANK